MFGDVEVEQPKQGGVGVWRRTGDESPRPSRGDSESPTRPPGPYGARAPLTGFTPYSTHLTSRKKASTVSAGLKLQWPYRL